MAPRPRLLAAVRRPPEHRDDRPVRRLARADARRPSSPSPRPAPSGSRPACSGCRSSPARRCRGAALGNVAAARRRRTTSRRSSRRVAGSRCASDQPRHRRVVRPRRTCATRGRASCSTRRASPPCSSRTTSARSATPSTRPPPRSGHHGGCRGAAEPGPAAVDGSRGAGWVVFGAGGHARSVVDVLERRGDTVVARWSGEPPVGERVATSSPCSQDDAYAGARPLAGERACTPSCPPSAANARHGLRDRARADRAAAVERAPPVVARQRRRSRPRGVLGPGTVVLEHAHVGPSSPARRGRHRQHGSGRRARLRRRRRRPPRARAPPARCCRSRRRHLRRGGRPGAAGRPIGLRRDRSGPGPWSSPTSGRRPSSACRRVPAGPERCLGRLRPTPVLPPQLLRTGDHRRRRPSRPPGDVYVIAEAGVNHNGDVDLAHRLIDIAASSGADAVKFQTFSPDKLVSSTAATTPYQRERGGVRRPAQSLLEALTLPKSAWAELRDHAAEAGIDVPVDALRPRQRRDARRPRPARAQGELGELTNLPVPARSSSGLGVTLLVSTGMGDRRTRLRRRSRPARRPRDSSSSTACRPTRRRSRSATCGSSRASPSRTASRSAGRDHTPGPDDRPRRRRARCAHPREALHDATAPCPAPTTWPAWSPTSSTDYVAADQAARPRARRRHQGAACPPSRRTPCSCGGPGTLRPTCTAGHRPRRRRPRAAAPGGWHQPGRRHPRPRARPRRRRRRAPHRRRPPGPVTVPPASSASGSGTGASQTTVAVFVGTRADLGPLLARHRGAPAGTTVGGADPHRRHVRRGRARAPPCPRSVTREQWRERVDAARRPDDACHGRGPDRAGRRARPRRRAGAVAGSRPMSSSYSATAGSCSTSCRRPSCSECRSCTCTAGR